LRQLSLRISIVIPALNEQQMIQRAVERAWAAAPDEVIVVDGGSRDDTAELAARQGARVVRSSRGRAVQLNTGAACSRGDVLLFLHADNWIEPDALKQIERALINPRVPGGAFRQRIESDRRLYRLIERGNALRASWRRLPYGDQGIFLRRRVFDELGRFPEVPLMEDVLLMHRLRRQAKPVLLPGPIHVDPRRWEQEGILRQTLLNWGLVAALYLGVKPKSLVRFYPRHDRPRAGPPPGNLP
jgi:rSAM/selenodomain-associated transferase 2